MTGQDPLPGVIGRPSLPGLHGLVVRPICHEDSGRLHRMFSRLSPLTIYRRFFGPMREPSPSALRWMTNVDHDNREALVALDGDEIIAVVRWDRDASHEDEAEIALLVEDAWQRRGVGRALIQMLIDEALNHHLAVLTATALSDNTPVLRLLATSLGRPARRQLEGPQIRLTYRITDGPWPLAAGPRESGTQRSTLAAAG